MLVGSSVGRPESSCIHVPFKATKFFLVAEIMTLIFHNNTDECNALVDMLTFPNAEDRTSTLRHSLFKSGPLGPMA